MSESKDINVQLADGTLTKALIVISELTPCRLDFECSEWERQRFCADDLHGAFVDLRSWLDGLGVKLLCNGARVDVTPSGMSRGMSGGRKAYIIRLGKPSLSSDLVDVFEYAEPEKIGTVQQQKEFYKKWVSSLRG